MLTIEQWEVERAKLIQAQTDIQGVIGGYNADILSGGGPIGTIYTTTNLDAPWQARTDSDFWV